MINKDSLDKIEIAFIVVTIITLIPLDFDRYNNTFSIFRYEIFCIFAVIGLLIENRHSATMACIFIWLLRIILLMFFIVSLGINS